MTRLKSSYSDLLLTWENSTIQIDRLWNDIEINYTHPQRHYHTLTHLGTLITILEPYKKQIKDWEITQFAIFYHDIVYDVLRTDNEEQSGVWAERVMQSLNIESKRIERCKRHIIATKGHHISEDPDTNLFMDADLCILGTDWEIYSNYYSNIRKEYSIFPDNKYNEGRVNVLKKFLEKPAIFHTPVFQNPYEGNARHNLRQEIKMLEDLISKP